MVRDDAIQKAIRDASGRRADWLTHTMKAIGKGDMRKAPQVIADYYYRLGKWEGRLEGAAAGVAGTVVLTCLAAIVADMIKDKQILESDGQRMLRDIDMEMNKQKKG